ncbi:aminotransferase class V-fold PLP-dependent enzyme [Plantibacter sp. VKM Ac-2880]|uniref:aminotransferase class V-fold PLP-dependent enzyme n=1 Tax=Plantibacter sp. VKM Ac-2880 TaxID=2783827 RepID=UPI00189051F8|nr:aminotransferase class V-fold PLP-dependent enzyme [Plantibacter sp. VKM Ac-2880]MBF4568650.1 aminotransferase class V-fold PLP-dependent enzyme [Plantibacter sp. VKM Ac-2880]
MSRHPDKQTADPGDADDRLSAFQADFGEDTGYLNYGSVGPLSRRAEAEAARWNEVLGRAVFGGLADVDALDARMRATVGALTGFRPDQIVAQPNTSQGLVHTMFGLSGVVLLSAAEYPSLPLAAERASQHRGVLTPRWLETDRGHVTADRIRSQLDDEVTAVAVSLVDYRTGFVADLHAIREVIGDRLLIVDAIQGFGVVDAPFEAADVVASGGQKWMRAGWGTGFLALSDRALDRLEPVLSGVTGTEEPWPYAETPEPSRTASAYSITRADPFAAARFAASLEATLAVGTPVIQRAIAGLVSEAIELADEFGIPVLTSRDERERAGIVALEPEEEVLETLSASLANHGVTATTRGATVRLSVHAGTTRETLELLRGALVSFATAASY